MVAWIELAVIGVMVGVGVCAGRWVGKRRWWWVGFCGAMVFVGLVIVGRRWAGAGFVWPMRWMIDPRVGPVVMAGAVPVMLSVLMMKLPEERKRVMVGVLMGAMVLYFAVVPLALPLMVRGSLAGTVTEVNHDGVCLQKHAYSCGPAAAVTCLRVLGVKGEEGAIGVAAMAAPGIGTDERMLTAAVNGLYGAEGVRCEFRFVGKVEALRVPAVVSIWSPQYGGHYLAVLEVGKDFVVVGDPLSGRQRMGRGEFLGEWSGAGVEICARAENKKWPPRGDHLV